MRKYPTGVIVLIGGVGLALGVAYWFSAPYREDLRLRKDAKNYRDRLSEEVRAAQEVDAIEHSWHYDRRSESGESVITEIREYRRIRLNSTQRAELARRIGRCDPGVKRSFSLSIFEPHHSLLLSGSDGSVSRVLVDDWPDHLQWSNINDQWGDMVDTLYPEALPGVIRDWFSSEGFRLHADWNKIAEPQR